MKSFRTRLVLWNAVVLLIVLVAFGWSAAILTEQAVVRNVDHEIEQFLRRGRGPGGPPPGAGPGGPPPIGVRRFEDDPNGPRVITPDGAGDVLSQSGFEAVTRGGFDVRTETIDGRPIRVGSLNRPMPDGGWQVVQVGRDLSDAQAALAQQRTILLLLLPIGVVAAVVGGLMFVRRALKPVEDVTRAAREISAEDLGRRLEVVGDDELAQLASTFNGMIERLDASFSTLERSYEKQKQFVADASHELRTPLSRIKVVTSSALSQSTNEQERVEALRTIDNATDEMTRLVEGLLQLARADSGALHLASEQLDLAEIVKSAVDAVNGSRIVVESQQGIVAIGDADATKRIVINLLSNAARYADSRITVTTSMEEGKANIRVHDDGEGIAPEHLERIKERFFRVESSRAKFEGGVGLGLAICDSLAQAMGGSLEIESEQGKGTTATLILPSAE